MKDKPLFRIVPRQPAVEFNGKQFDTAEEAKAAAINQLFRPTSATEEIQFLAMAKRVVERGTEILAILSYEPDGEPAKAKAPKRTLSKEQYELAVGALPAGQPHPDYALARRRVQDLGYSVADAVSKPPRERKAKVQPSAPPADPTSPGIRIEASSKHKGA